MADSFGFALLMAGMVIAAAGYVWLLHNVFRAHQGWGHLGYFVPPILVVAVFVFWRKAVLPFLVVAVGAGLSASPFWLQRYWVDFGPRERIVDGELHVTLTGWDRKSYAMLLARPETIVLQMANGDVTDETLTNLRGMENLKELDLSNTGVKGFGFENLSALKNLEILRLRKSAVDDAGLAYIGTLPSLRVLDLNDTGTSNTGLAQLHDLKNLETLRLRNTKIQPTGFFEALAPLPKLKSVEVTRTSVRSSDVRKWLRDRNKN